MVKVSIITVNIDHMVKLFQGLHVIMFVQIQVIQALQRKRL